MRLRNVATRVVIPTTPVTLLLILTTVFGAWSPAWAAGFAVTAQGGAGIARSSAVTAQADDPSALYYNPAGIIQLDQAAGLIGAAVLRPHADYEPSGAGAAATERERYYVLPHLYLTAPIGPRLVAGLGLFSPFGLSTKWLADWDGRFQVIDATIRTATINPALAWRPSARVAVAGGLQYSVVELSLRRAIDLSSVALPEGVASLSGEGRAVGFTAGMLVAPSPSWQVGLSFRSRMNAEVRDGWADFTVPAPAAAMFADATLRTAVTLPPSLRTGVLVRVTPHWTVEGDATWTGWSTVDRLEIRFTNGLADDITTFRWRDAMTYSLGAEYEVSPTVRLRGGLLYDRSPIPDQYLNPLIPDADRRGASLGIGIGSGRWTLDAGYQFLWFERIKNNAVGAASGAANGRYRSQAHVAGVSAGWRWPTR
ncbi:MAG: OmpP1/FadL family transporter [Nitrospirota bacterium]